MEKVAGKGWFTKSLAIQGQATSIGGLLTSVPVRLKLIITDTGQMLQACSQLHESGSTGLAFLEELNEITYSITPDSWQANDQVADFESEIRRRDEYGRPEPRRPPRPGKTAHQTNDLPLHHHLCPRARRIKKALAPSRKTIRSANF